MVHFEMYANLIIYVFVKRKKCSTNPPSSWYVPMATDRAPDNLLKGGFLLSRNFSVRTHINFTRANKIDIVREVTHIRY